jgi:hypothetical protein
MLISDYRKLGAVTLPYAGRQKYIHTFDLAVPVMAAGFEDYLAPVVALCATAGATHGVAHMTVDEKVVAAGMSQRRPKPHVDGCFMPAQGSWGNPGWLHCCNNIPLEGFQRMPVIVASSAIGCRAWRGKFDVDPAGDGDVSQLDLGHGEVFRPNVGYLLSADCVHESMIQKADVQRSFLRIALPVAFRF